MTSVTRGIDCHKYRIVSIVLSFGFLLVLFFDLHHGSEKLKGNGIERSMVLDGNLTIGVRKLLQSAGNGGSNRIGGCSKDDIAIYQGPTAPLPNGIPTYTVQILNLCVGDICPISNIHVSCGWFSSARMINPNLFRRVAYDDCIVNNGEPLCSGQAITFQYANSFSYPLSVSSVTC